MYLSFITGNVLQKLSSNKKNIVFYPQNNLFDHTVFQLIDNNYYIFGDNKTNYSIPNVIDLPQSHLSLYNYNLSITNNIIGYSTSNLKKFHINSIIFTHSYRPHFIKKEDASILNNNLSKEIKIFFSENARKSWGINHRYEVIKYGIPKEFNNLGLERPKDVLILNFDKAVHNSQLLRAMKSRGYECDTLDSNKMSIDQLNSICNQYKICIDFADHNVVNLLCSIASGCKAIGLKTEMLANDYGDVPGLYLINSPSEVIDTIGSIIKDTDTIEDNSVAVHEMFDFNSFSESLKNSINTINQEAFII